MQKDFKLETILSVTTGINLTNHFEDVYELGCFMFNDPLMTMTNICYLKNDMKKHIFDIHPELKSVCYVPSNTRVIDAWLYIMKCVYGEYLPISRIGKELNVIEKIKK